MAMMANNLPGENEQVEVSAQILSAYTKGRLAYRSSPYTECPYEDKLNRLGHPTFSRAYRTAWMRGFIDEAENKPERFKKRVSNR
jgi:hypothetical protein